MDKSEVDAALYWLSWINSGKTVAAFLVAIGVAGEFLGDFLAKPFSKIVEAARQTEIARLNNETAKLQERLAWRTLTKEQSDKITECLKPFAGQRVDVFSYSNDPEGEALSDQLSGVLKSSKWDVGSGKTTEHSKLLYGVRVETASSTPETDGIIVRRMALTPAGENAAEALASTLRDNGILATEGPVPFKLSWRAETMLQPGVIPLSEAPVRVTVGIKPR